MTDGAGDEVPSTVADGTRPSLLMVTTIAPTIDHFLLPYATHLRNLGWRVDAAANGASSDALINGAFDHVFELPISRSILDVPGLWRGMRAMRSVLVSRPDMVHVHTPIAAFITRAAIRRLPAERRPSVVYTAHGFHFHAGGSRLTNAIFLTAERIAGRWTDRLVVINDDDYEAALRYHIVPARRLVHMPGIGADSSHYARATLDARVIADAKAAAGAGPDDPLFVSVGELSQRKRMADVIAAVTQMRHREAKLAIAGEGTERGHLEALIDRYGVRDRVRLAGEVADVRPLVASALALILASDREGLPRSIMEALLLEVPVIASAVRGSRDLVNDRTGITFPVGDVPALAAAMDRLVEDQATAREMGRLGRVRMVAGFSLARLLALHDQLYEQLAEERTRPHHRP